MQGFSSRVPEFSSGFWILRVCGEQGRGGGMLTECEPDAVENRGKQKRARTFREGHPPFLEDFRRHFLCESHSLDCALGGSSAVIC